MIPEYKETKKQMVKKVLLFLLLLVLMSFCAYGAIASGVGAMAH